MVFIKILLIALFDSRENMEPVGIYRKESSCSCMLLLFCCWKHFPRFPRRLQIILHTQSPRASISNEFTVEGCIKCHLATTPLVSTTKWVPVYYHHHSESTKSSKKKLINVFPLLKYRSMIKVSFGFPQVTTVYQCRNLRVGNTYWDEEQSCPLPRHPQLRLCSTQLR